MHIFFNFIINTLFLLLQILFLSYFLMKVTLDKSVELKQAFLISLHKRYHDQMDAVKGHSYLQFDVTTILEKISFRKESS